MAINRGNQGGMYAGMQKKKPHKVSRTAVRKKSVPWDKRKHKKINTVIQQRQKFDNHVLENKRKRMRAHLIAIKKCKYNWDSLDSFNWRLGV